MLSVLIKKALYSVYPAHSLSVYKLDLGYIFHTECIYHEPTFNGLLDFCKKYSKLTGARAICTIMTGVNAMVKSGMEKNNCSEELFLERVIRLSQVSTIGYHGHFWSDTSKFKEDVFALHSTTAIESKLQHQLEQDLEWFEKNSISHNGIYAGGWWFQNEFLIQKLIEANFNADYSFSKAPYFYNAFSKNLMVTHGIKTGEAFYLKPKASANKILCIQNLIGAHHTPFPLDFDRNLKKILDSPKIIGVVNAHDYDRNFETTMSCLEHLLKDSSAKFFSSHELIQKAKDAELKEIAI
jgi:hypothetical protein